MESRFCYQICWNLYGIWSLSTLDEAVLVVGNVRLLLEDEEEEDGVVAGDEVDIFLKQLLLDADVTGSLLSLLMLMGEESVTEFEIH